ncbi:hypothetical protein BU26DRAFT_50539 [Trematosphaeria pertusa]|uniref:Uncharacterized protein n=1 Tax=Trematosphaeria pertusa TaxID=390896 RepID=A0A6A6I8F6_9PLEO|nr:uncharacterized protein BU26DRAFT_50539 [Trematosphaeria pertusa]KAF2246636.1 hypothetical protein BU26DRAFT_50539 [Trematosphaeria pertusa]
MTWMVSRLQRVPAARPLLSMIRLFVGNLTHRSAQCLSARTCSYCVFPQLRTLSFVRTSSQWHTSPFSRSSCGRITALLASGDNLAAHEDEDQSHAPPALFHHFYQPIFYGYRRPARHTRSCFRAWCRIRRVYAPQEARTHRTPVLERH